MPPRLRLPKPPTVGPVSPPADTSSSTTAAVPPPPGPQALVPPNPPSGQLGVAHSSPTVSDASLGHPSAPPAPNTLLPGTSTSRTFTIPKPRVPVPALAVGVAAKSLVASLAEVPAADSRPVEEPHDGPLPLPLAAIETTPTIAATVAVDAHASSSAAPLGDAVPTLSTLPQARPDSVAPSSHPLQVEHKGEHVKFAQLGNTQATKTTVGSATAVGVHPVATTTEADSAAENETAAAAIQVAEITAANSDAPVLVPVLQAVSSTPAMQMLSAATQGHPLVQRSQSGKSLQNNLKQAGESSDSDSDWSLPATRPVSRHVFKASGEGVVGEVPETSTTGTLAGHEVVVLAPAVPELPPRVDELAHASDVMRPQADTIADVVGVSTTSAGIKLQQQPSTEVSPHVTNDGAGQVAAVSSTATVEEFATPASILQAQAVATSIVEEAQAFASAMREEATALMDRARACMATAAATEAETNERMRTHTQSASSPVADTLADTVLHASEQMEADLALPPSPVAMPSTPATTLDQLRLARDSALNLLLKVLQYASRNEGRHSPSKGTSPGGVHVGSPLNMPESLLHDIRREVSAAGVWVHPRVSATLEATQATTVPVPHQAVTGTPSQSVDAYNELFKGTTSSTSGRKAAGTVLSPSLLSTLGHVNSTPTFSSGGGKARAAGRTPTIAKGVSMSISTPAHPLRPHLVSSTSSLSRRATAIPSSAPLSRVKPMLSPSSKYTIHTPMHPVAPLLTATPHGSGAAELAAADTSHDSPNKGSGGTTTYPKTRWQREIEAREETFDTQAQDIDWDGLVKAGAQFHTFQAPVKPEDLFRR